MKLKELRQAYQKTREANGRSGSEPQTCRFYDELHAILGGSATTTPAVFFDSFNGDGGNMEAGFGDEEDDDEVVDSSQQAGGETGFPDSQELFLTLDLEPVPPVLPKAASRTARQRKDLCDLSGLHACRGMASAQKKGVERLSAIALREGGPDDMYPEPPATMFFAPSGIGISTQNSNGQRRLRELWDSYPQCNTPEVYASLGMHCLHFAHNKEMQGLTARMKHHEKRSFSEGNRVEDDERNISENAGSSGSGFWKNPEDLSRCGDKKLQTTDIKRNCTLKILLLPKEKLKRTLLQDLLLSLPAHPKQYWYVYTTHNKSIFNCSAIDSNSTAARGGSRVDGGAAAVDPAP
ncbi:hypothetical protein UY3_09872 [Chelonia mydas]|uniref:Uncharacterized protein n=1 Tax=Chelonia mydas TaxID=8469 RepID=M7B792_CHEMY|nr:hypothetical protein UY3_09872 [Chelonia mydas]